MFIVHLVRSMNISSRSIFLRIDIFQQFDTRLAFSETNTSGNTFHLQFRGYHVKIRYNCCIKGRRKQKEKSRKIEASTLMMF